jgi:NAD(P)-dependent dehydrogenase (short-subunit alcohol dehydrogenase family)
MALTLARYGANVAIVDIDPEGAQRTVDEIHDIGRKSIHLTIDITEYEQVQAQVHQLLETKEFHQLHVLINSAGIAPRNVQGPFPEIWRRLLEVNLTGTYFCCLVVGGHMIDHRSGSIINIGSMSASIINKWAGEPSDPPIERTAGYCAAKAGVVHLTRALAAGWAKYHVRVNSISPGYMNTPLLQRALQNPAIHQHMENLIPMGRVGEPDELSGAVVFLASEASSYVTGHDLIIDGGYTCW